MCKKFYFDILLCCLEVAKRSTALTWRANSLHCSNDLWEKNSWQLIMLYICLFPYTHKVRKAFAALRCVKLLYLNFLSVWKHSKTCLGDRLSPSPPSLHQSLLLHRGFKQQLISIFMKAPDDKWKQEKIKEPTPFFIVFSSHIDHTFNCNYFLNSFDALCPPCHFPVSLYYLFLMAVSSLFM